MFFLGSIFQHETLPTVLFSKRLDKTGTLSGVDGLKMAKMARREDKRETLLRKARRVQFKLIHYRGGISMRTVRQKFNLSCFLA